MIGTTPHFAQGAALQASDAGGHGNNRARFSAHATRMGGSQPVWRPHVAPASYAPETAGTLSVETDRTPKFGDIIDVINPLHHLPVVGTVYRKVTGDEISPPAQFIGGLAYGGPLGAAGALVDIAVTERTGRGLGENALALATGDPTAFNVKAKTAPAVLDKVEAINWTEGPHESTPVIEVARATAMQMARQRFDAGGTRMAGTQPVWQDHTNAGRASAQTSFDTMVAQLSA